MSRTLPSLPSWPNGKPLPAGGITIIYDPGTNLEYGLDLSRLGGGATPYHVGAYTARASGAQIITSAELPSLDSAVLIVSVGVRGVDAQGTPTLDPLPSTSYSLINGVLTVGDTADIDKDDVLEVQWLTAGQLAAAGLSVTQLAGLLVAGDGITITPQNGKLLISSTVVAATPKAPAAPTAGQVDDTADTFSFLPNPAYPAAAQYKVVGRPGVSGAEQLDATNSYVSGTRIYIKVVGAVAKNGLAVYVAGSGALPDGAVLINAEAFTGAVVTTPPPTTTYTATQQSYTTTEADYQAACGKAYEGAFVGVMRSNSSETSTNSQAEANARALAAATQAAKNAITCQVQPVAYDNTTAAGSTVKGVTLGAQPSDTLEFNNASGADNSAVTMELWLSGEQVAAVPYENYYTGKPFRFTHNALKYTKNFAAGRIDL